MRFPRPHLAPTPAAVIVLCAIALTILGLTVLFSATATVSKTPFFYLTKQLIGVGLAVVVGFVVSRIDLEWARGHVKLIAIGALALLVLVLVPHIGISVNGSRRWLGLGPVRLQVSEIGKIAMVFCLAHYLAINQVFIGRFKRGFLIPMVIVVCTGGLVAKEPDLGTAALIMAVGVLMLFLAGVRWRYLFAALIAGAGAFSLMVYLMPNRLTRFTAFLDVEGNKQDGTYQLYQSLAAFAVGGVNGAGLGQGLQQQHYLPEAHTDFIFSVVGEELGLYFTIGVVALFIVIFIAGIVHLRRAPNLFQFLLVSGALLLLSMQAIINLGVVTGVLPTKGMSLPFVSAGLSNLLLMGAIVGIFVNTQRAWSRPALSPRRRTLREVVQT
ncbi:cell cycle protein [Termitidicoccus mucosus]|uniref:Probable peptidoglycan glycosyltransferase FtsW n=1 Tax=Termitidicoccus mucosus TaxID=1184151 RepID=A0A178IQA7_9BACT|nr:cell cycle protein [Opitutaceae bacterium TSB47]